MAARKDHGASVGDDEPYEKVREQGAGREKAERIAECGRSTMRRDDLLRALRHS